MQESKNISAKARGNLCEEKALAYYQDKNFKLIGQNQKINSIEIDLILFKNHYYLVEVKSLKNTDEMSFRLSMKQRKRLLVARNIYETQKNTVVELIVFYVHKNQFFEIGIEDHL